MATAKQIKALQTRLDTTFGKGKVKSTEDTWSKNKLALDTMEAAGKVPVLNQSGSTKGKSKASEAALKAYPNMPESYKEMLSDLAGREGYNPNFYLDGSGYLTTGVGLTGEYVADETPFRSMTDHENKAKRLVPGLEYYTPEIQKSIIHAAYRGDLTYPKDDKYGNKAGDTYKWVNNLNNGNWNEAADELLRNDEYFASRGEDSKGNSVDIKNPGLQSYFESIHDTLKEQHYIENPDARTEDSGFISDTIDEGIAFGNKVLRKVDGTVDSAIDSVSGFIDEMFSTGEIPQEKVPPTTTQDIPVPEQGATVPKAENEMATQAQVDSYLKKRNEKQVLSGTDRVDVPRRNQPDPIMGGVIVGREPVDRVGEYIGPNEVVDNPMYAEELRQLMQQQEVNRMQQGQIPAAWSSTTQGLNPFNVQRYPTGSEVRLNTVKDGVDPILRDASVNAQAFTDQQRQQQSQLNMTNTQGTVDPGLLSGLSKTQGLNPFNVQRYPTGSDVRLNTVKDGVDPKLLAYLDSIPNVSTSTPPKSGYILDGNGRPVLDGNNRPVMSGTTNRQAPAGGKGSNATAQSAIDQLTGIKGFGGK